MLLVFVPLLAHSQSDSIKQNSNFKQDVRFLQNEKSISVKNKTNANSYKSKATSLFVSGTVLSVAGISFMALGVYYYKTQQKEIAGYKYIDSNDGTKMIIYFSIGSTITVAGLILEAFGGHNMSLYRNEKSKVTLKLSDRDIGLALNF